MSIYLFRTKNVCVYELNIKGAEILYFARHYSFFVLSPFAIFCRPFLFCLRFFIVTVKQLLLSNAFNATFSIHFEMEKRMKNLITMICA